MLVNRKYNREVHQEEVQTPVLPQPIRRTANRLRSQCFTMILLAVVMGMFVTAQNAAIVRAGYNLVQVKSEVAKNDKEIEILKLDIAKLKTPQRIEEIATHELGMVAPHNTYYAAAAADKQPAPPQSVTLSLLKTTNNLADKLSGLLTAENQGQNAAKAAASTLR